ncbi:MAG: hypothetical protein V3S01_00760 [Dehalococcoidia bacterium]
MARIALGSNVREGPRRGKVVAHRPKGMVDVQFDDVEWEERRPETRLQRGNPVGSKDLYDPDLEQWRRQVLGIYKTELARGRTPKQAKEKAFEIAGGVGQRDKRLKPGTTQPTAKGRRAAKQKLQTADAAEKRQEWELMLAKGRKAGKYRVVPQKADGRTRYYVQPGGRYFLSPEKAEAHAGSLNGKPAVRIAANPRRRKNGSGQGFGAWLRSADNYLQDYGFGHEEFPESEWARLYDQGTSWQDAVEYLTDKYGYSVNPPLRENWLPAAAAVITIADVGYRAARARRKKANPERRLRGGKIVRSLTPDQKAAYDWYEARAAALWNKWMRANEEGDEAMLEYIEGLETALNNAAPVVMEARGVEFSTGKPSMDRVYRVWPRKLAAWKKTKNPRELSELGGMRRGFASLPAAARFASTKVRVLAEDKAKKYMALQEVPPSKKQKFEQLRRALERDIDDIDRQFRSLVISVTEQIPAAASGLASDEQKRAEAGMKGEYRRTYGEALLQHERRRAARRARRAHNPKKKRTKGISRTGIGYAWANIRSAQGAGDYYPPTLMRQFDPTTGESEFLMVFDPGRGRFKRRGNFIRDMIRQSNRQRGLKGPAWERDKAITNKIFAEATPAGLAAAERYVIQHPKSGRGSERDPYRIRDLTKDAHRQIVFVSPRKKEADAKLAQLQGRPKGGEFLGTAGDPIEGWATPSRSRAGWVVKALEDKGITVKVDRGVFEDLEVAAPTRRVVQTGPYQISGVGPRPSVERRRRFFPRSYTLIGAKGPAFSNQEFKSPRAAAGFAVKQYIKSTEEQAYDRAVVRHQRALKKASTDKERQSLVPPVMPQPTTLMQQLEALDVAMPTYKALSEAEAKVRLYATQLGVQGFDVTEHKVGEGRDEVVTYKITAGASGHKPTIKKKTFTDYTLYGPGGGIVKVQSGNKAALERQRKRDGGRITSRKRTLYSLVRTSAGGAGQTVLFSSEDEGAVRAKLAEFETGPTRGQQAKEARDRMKSLQQEVTRLKVRMAAGGTPGAPHYTLLAHGPGGSIDFTPEGFVLTGPVGVVKLGLGGEARVEQIWMTKTGRYTLGHPELDWLGALSVGRLALSPGRAESLQERRKERAESELRAAGKRSPLVQAPSKRRELISQFQAGLGREGARQKVYLPDAPRKPRKMSKSKEAAERKRLAEKEAELAALRKNNPAWIAAVGRGAVASGKWLVTSPTGQKILGNAAAVATYYIGDRLMTKGKVSPEVMRYIQARVEKETGIKPTQAQVTQALTSIDPNKDRTLTADEVAKVLRKNRRR